VKLTVWICYDVCEIRDTIGLMAARLDAIVLLQSLDVGVACHATSAAEPVVLHLKPVTTKLLLAAAMASSMVI
jgi:hypothetical protein